MGNEYGRREMKRRGSEDDGMLSDTQKDDKEEKGRGKRIRKGVKD